MSKTSTYIFAVFVAICAAFLAFVPPAKAQPCQWNYSMQPGTPDPNQGTATATYCGNAIIQGNLTVNGEFVVPSPNTYASLALMATQTAAEMASQRVMTVQSYTAGTGKGGGQFIWLTAAEATTAGLTPDAGTIVGPSDDPSDCSSGCAVRIYNGELNVTFFGVTGTCVLTDPAAGILSCASGATEDTAFARARSAALAQRKNLFIPCGNYVMTNEFSLDDGASVYGFAVNGAGKGCTNIFWRPVDTTSVLFSMHGGSGYATNKGVSNLSIFPYDVSFRYLGNGIVIQDQDYGLFNSVVIQLLYRAAWLQNTNGSGFVEFNTFNDFIFKNNRRAAIEFTRTGGTDSFHGNSFTGEINIDNDGVTSYGVVAVAADEPSRLNIYGTVFNLKVFGSNSNNAYAFYVEHANITTVSGYLDVELPTIISSTNQGTVSINGPLYDPGAALTRTTDATSIILFDPDKGDWTPTLNFSGGNGTLAYTSLGTWTRSGQAVTLWGSIALSAIGTATGNASVGGFPFESAPSGARGYCSIFPTFITMGANYFQTYLSITANSLTGSIFKAGTGVNTINLTETGFVNASAFEFACPYRIDPY